MSELRRIEDERDASDPSAPTIDIPGTDPPPEPCENAAQCLCSYHTLRHLGELESIIGSTAPWWISASSHIGKEEELERECAKAADIVLGGIERLRPFWEHTTH